MELVFHEAALQAIAKRALLRGTGARGLKSIIEDVLLNSMFDVPSHPEIKRCIITEQTITEGIEPLMLTEDPAPALREASRPSWEAPRNARSV